MSKKELQSIINNMQVTAYSDYREFLADLYNRAREASSNSYSYENFAEDLGFSATNVLRLVISRKRTLAASSALTIVKALNLKYEHRRYFLAMVSYVNARSQTLREKYFKKMLQEKQASMVSHRDKDQLAFLSEWYHWVVLEMLRLQGANADPEWLAGQINFSVPADKIRRSLALLEAIGLTTKNQSTGATHVVDGSPMLVPSDDTTARLAMTQHHKSMIETSKEALVKLPAEQIEFNALTLSVSLDSFREMQERARKFCEDMMAIEAREQNRECVAQFNLNLFSLTKWNGRS